MTALNWITVAEVQLAEAYAVLDAQGARQGTLESVRVALDNGFIHIDTNRGTAETPQIMVFPASAVGLVRYAGQTTPAEPFVHYGDDFE